VAAPLRFQDWVQLTLVVLIQRRSRTTSSKPAVNRARPFVDAGDQIIGG
jgi:hypothetical protein